MTARVVYIIPQHPQLNTPRCNISCLLRVNYHVVYRGTEKKTLGGALGEPHFKQENHISQMIEFCTRIVTFMVHQGLFTLHS